MYVGGGYRVARRLAALDLAGEELRVRTVFP